MRPMLVPNGEKLPKVKKPKKGWFRPEKKSHVEVLLYRPAKEVFLLVLRVVNGVCRKMELGRSYTVARVVL